MRNSYRKYHRQTESVLVSVLILIATTEISSGQQLNMNVHQDSPEPSQEIQNSVSQNSPNVPDFSQEPSHENGEISTDDLEMNALEVLKGFFDGAFDEDEKHDIEAIAKLRRELIRLDLERQKTVLMSEINQLSNGGHTGNSEQYEDLQAEVELLKNALDKLQNAENEMGGEIVLPTVIEITGSLGDIESLILIPKVGMVTARKGTILPNGMVVDSINAEGVSVSIGSTQHILSIGGNISQLLTETKPDSNTGNTPN